MDYNDDRVRRVQASAFQAKAPELFEVVKKTSTGYDQRDQTTFYKTERLGVYSSELAALRAVLKLNPSLSVQPLKIDA